MKVLGWIAGALITVWLAREVWVYFMFMSQMGITWPPT